MVLIQLSWHRVWTALLSKASLQSAQQPALQEGSVVLSPSLLSSLYFLKSRLEFRFYDTPQRFEIALTILSQHNGAECHVIFVLFICGLFFFCLFLDCSSSVSIPSTPALTLVSRTPFSVLYLHQIHPCSLGSSTLFWYLCFSAFSPPVPHPFVSSVCISVQLLAQSLSSSLSCLPDPAVVFLPGPCILLILNKSANLPACCLLHLGPPYLLQCDSECEFCLCCLQYWIISFNSSLQIQCCRFLPIKSVQQFSEWKDYFFNNRK